MGSLSLCKLSTLTNWEISRVGVNAVVVEKRWRPSKTEIYAQVTIGALRTVKVS